MKVESSWFDRIKAKLQVLFKKSKKSNIKDIAGIRQSEVNIASRDSLFWMPQEETNFNTAYTFYLNNDWDKALPLLENIISENPLNSNSEIARSCLIIIYADKDKKIKAQHHLEKLLEDFPDSELKMLAEEGKKSL